MGLYKRYSVFATLHIDTVFRATTVLLSMAAAMFHQLPGYFSTFDDQCLFIFAETDDFTQFLVCECFAVSEHCGDFCKYDKCKFHILLFGEHLHGILLKLSHISYKYHFVDATYAYFKLFIMNGKHVQSKGDLMNKLQHAVRYNRIHPHMDIRPSVLRKRLARKIRKFHRVVTNTRSTTVQTVESGLQKRIQTILSGQFTLDFLKIIDCLCDGSGQLESKLVKFYIK